MAIEVLISAERIQQRVDEMAAQIVRDYGHQPITIVGVLTGSIMFLADLIRRLDFPLRVGLIQASSYRGAATRPGPLQVRDAGLPPLEGRDVLLLDDIFDTGQTLSHLLAHVQQQRPRSLRSAVLLWKVGRQRVEITPDFHCFRIPDLFVVGYGLDYQDYYRHLRHVAAACSKAKAADYIDAPARRASPAEGADRIARSRRRALQRVSRCARSSVDRVLASEARGRAFDPRRARQH